jgi:predicted DNA-binding mobile mystery protein A
MSDHTQGIQLQGLDEPIVAMQATRRAIKRPTAGWLKAVRQACGETVASIASKIGISRQAYSRFEEREARGTISVENLERAANALDCDLVYFLLPITEIADNFAALAARNDPDVANLQASEHSMQIEGQGVQDPVDATNIGLAKQLYWLRQNLSLYELISVNAGKIKEVGASDALFGLMQNLSLEAIVVTLCKIYEQEQSKDLNSIDGVINALAESGYNDAQRRAAERFSARHGIPRTCDHPKDFLRNVLATFVIGKSDVFNSLRRFRNNYAVHSVHGFGLEALPSFDDFEVLYQFGYDFYFLISDTFLGVGPALMTLRVATGFNRLLRQIGVEHPAPGFSTKEP